MKTTFETYTVEQICDGFEYNELEGKENSRAKPSKSIVSLNTTNWKAKACTACRVN